MCILAPEDISLSESAAGSKDKAALLALCTVVDDPAPAFNREHVPLLRKDYPFSDRVWVQTMAPLIERNPKVHPDASQTIGSLARAQLRKATKKDFGSDPVRWRQWVESR